MKEEAKQKLISVAIVATAVLIAALIFYYPGIRGLVVKFASSPAPRESPKYVPTREEGTRKALLSKAKLSFTQVAGQEEKVDLYLSFSQLPKELIPFIKTEAQDAKFQKASYSDGKQGFFIEYKLAEIALEKVYREFRELAISGGWQPLYGARANLFAFQELENPIYQLRISLSPDDDKSVTVTIEVMIK